MNTSIKTIKAYIAQYPAKTQTQLRQLYALIREAVPQADESISYGMPAFKLNGKPLAYFGGFTNHVSLFPTASPLSAFKKELKNYTYTKGTIHFELDSALPKTLIKRIVKFRATEILQKTKSKK